MISSRRSEKNGCRGTAAIELSLAMPLLMMVLFGTMEFSNAFLIRRNLVTAAAEAVRIGSQSTCPRPTAAMVLAATRTTLASLGLDPLRATISLTNAGGVAGTEMVADVAYAAAFPVISTFVALPTVQNGIMTVSVRVAAENE